MCSKDSKDWSYYVDPFNNKVNKLRYKMRNSGMKKKKQNISSKTNICSC